MLMFCNGTIVEHPCGKTCKDFAFGELDKGWSAAKSNALRSLLSSSLVFDTPRYLQALTIIE